MTVAQGEERFELPALWLRERCQDADHLDPTTQQRLFDPHQLPDDLALTAAERKDDEGVELAFSDGYRGYYHLPALAAEFDPYDGCPEPQPWTADLDRGQQTFEWPSLATEQALHAATVAFLRYGFIILRDVPTQPEEILTVARTFGNLRETNFGQYFEVYSRPQSNDLAYRPVHLGPHTDNPYREPVPGIQLLHCLVNETSGGWSTLVDSLSVGEQLASEDPEGFAMLSTNPGPLSLRGQHQRTGGASADHPPRCPRPDDRCALQPSTRLSATAAGGIAPAFSPRATPARRAFRRSPLRGSFPAERR
ncbi:MAG: TauD/TfdA family dioxygenase [Arhodomonas sp.]|nr:TauD/TfdA family dioxygenase [Arhodomonas sp.]